MNDLRVLVVADDPLARAGLATMLSGVPGCEVVGQVGSEAGVADAVEVYQPDVVVWDTGWDAARSVERLEDFSEAASTPVVALALDEEDASAVWSAGVQGLVPRDVDADRLFAAISAAAHGLSVLDPALARALSPPRSQPPAMPAAPLTAREQQVLRLLSQGMPNKAIAHELDICEHTVKFHLNSIMGKLGAQSRTEAVIIATRLGLILL